MIARLRGKPIGRGVEGLLLDVNGVGYLVHATPRALAKAGGDEITVETYLHVREDALSLYGFADGEERELFIQLLSVSGIGPKVALAIVSGSTPASSGGRSRAKTLLVSRPFPASARRRRSALCWS